MARYQLKDHELHRKLDELSGGQFGRSLYLACSRYKRNHHIGNWLRLETIVLPVSDINVDLGIRIFSVEEVTDTKTIENWWDHEEDK